MNQSPSPEIIQQPPLISILDTQNPHLVLVSGRSVEIYNYCNIIPDHPTCFDGGHLLPPIIGEDGIPRLDIQPRPSSCKKCLQKK